MVAMNGPFRQADWYPRPHVTFRHWKRRGQRKLMLQIKWRDWYWSLWS